MDLVEIDFCTISCVSGDLAWVKTWAIISEKGAKLRVAIGMDNFAALASQRLACEPPWRERLWTEQPGCGKALQSNPESLRTSWMIVD